MSLELRGSFNAEKGRTEFACRDCGVHWIVSKDDMLDVLYCPVCGEERTGDIA